MSGSRRERESNRTEQQKLQKSTKIHMDIYNMTWNGGIANQ